MNERVITAVRGQGETYSWMVSLIVSWMVSLRGQIRTEWASGAVRLKSLLNHGFLNADSHHKLVQIRNMIFLTLSADLPYEHLINKSTKTIQM